MYLLLPLYLGFATVLQSGLNRIISREWGLSAVTFMNSVVLTVPAAVFWWVTYRWPEKLPEIFQNPGGAFAQWSWWYWIPGVLGLSVVAGIPFAIARIGALQTFVFLIAAQIVASMGWDAIAEGKAINLARVVGALLAFGGALLVNLKG
jgi:transporter family-2 protein